MATRISKSDYINLIKIHCINGRHKFRENSLGIVWCTVCGKLSTNNKGKVLPLSEHDKLIIMT